MSYAVRRSHQKMGWWQATWIFASNNNEPMHFIKIMALLGIGVFDDALDFVPIIDILTFGDNFVLIGFGIFAIVRIRAIHRRGNNSAMSCRS